MSEFTAALPFIIKHEGTTLYEDQETGERSRYGITQKLLKLIQYKITDPNLLTMDNVSEIYSNVFWNPNQFGKLSSQLIANKVFDMSVNMGATTAVRLLQAALNMCGAQCVIDGVIGPHTLITVNQFAIGDNEERLLGELVLQSISYYKRIAIGPLAKDLKGWLARAEDTGMGQADKNAFNTLRDGSSDKVVS